jgi:GntR family transcriptional regulator / MocR family aminotransferase
MTGLRGAHLRIAAFALRHSLMHRFFMASPLPGKFRERRRTAAQFAPSAPTLKAEARRIEPPMLIPLLLDRSRPESLTAQIADQLREAIRLGRIAAGARMPSSRKLADQLDIARNTAVRAYEVLVIEGYVESRPASGFFAAQQLPEVTQRPLGLDDLSRSDPTPLAYPTPLPHLPARSHDLVHPSRSRLAYDFMPGRPNTSLFPLKTWRRLMQTCLSHGGAMGLSHYADPAGLPLLRSAIAAHVAATRGIIADVNRIIVVGGIQQGISIAGRLFLGPDSVGVVEDPCYQGAAFAFEACGARVIGVPVDANGLVTDELPRRRTSLLYVTPAHQYPTGHQMSLARRRELIAWARRNGCYILEDDYDGDFRYEGAPWPAIAALASDCTIYLGTFSKSLGAGLRLGYMVVPARLADAVRSAKALLDNGNSWLEQAVVAEMLKSGSYAAHVARIRGRYKENRDTLLAALRRHFGDVTVSGQQAGLHLLWHLPPGVPDAQMLEAVARRVRIGLYPFGLGGVHDAQATVLSQRAIILGYAALQPKQIEQGVARLSDAIDDALELPSSGLLQAACPRSPAADWRGPYLASTFVQKPALRSRPRRDASSQRMRTTQEALPMPVIAEIYRYPIKGLSAQRVTSVAVVAGQPFPSDRIFALARPESPIDPAAPKRAKKGSFVMLMLDEALARVTTNLDVETFDLTILRSNDRLLHANLHDEKARIQVEEFFESLVPSLKKPPRLVHAPGMHFMDKPDSVLSLINVATLRSLEEQWGFALDPLRFRANFYIDGARPWEEFDWIGSDIVLGGAVFRVDRRNGRCGATNVNPVSGNRDLDIPGSLRATLGHKDLGIYLVARKGGTVAVGDELKVPRSEVVTHVDMPRLRGVAAARRFMCRGCYFIYEEAQGLPAQSIPAGTFFSDIPHDWRCPDCGTDKGKFRPYVEAGAAANS